MENDPLYDLVSVTIRLRHVCAIALLAATTAEAGSRLTWDRTIAPAHSLGGAQDVLITYAIGDNDKISTFIDVFMDQANRGGTLRVLDPTLFEHSRERSHRWRRPPKFVEGHYRADAYLRIDAFRCQTSERTGEGGAYDVNGNRVHETHKWIDAVCVAHIHALAKDQKKLLAEFSVGGEGTSPRSTRVSDEDRDIAMDQAARYAAVAAAEQITPRRVRESIELDETAPSFGAAMVYVDTGDFRQARRTLEAALPAHRDSAALHFDLAAVCEAAGDTNAAAEHYAAAQLLAPKDARYRHEAEAFRHRAGVKK